MLGEWRHGGCGSLGGQVSWALCSWMVLMWAKDSCVRGFLILSSASGPNRESDSGDPISTPWIGGGLQPGTTWHMKVGRIPISL